MIHKNKAHCQTISNTIHRSEQSRLPDRWKYQMDSSPLMVSLKKKIKNYYQHVF